MNTPSPKPTEIAKCPFCGSAPMIFQREHPAITHVPLAWIVQCTGCTAETCSEHRQWAIDYWNRRPAPETQVVAYRNPETGHVCSREKWESMGSSFRQGMCQPLYRSPVESAPALAPFEKDSVETYMSLTKEQLVGLLKSACDEIDRLSAVVEEVRGK